MDYCIDPRPDQMHSRGTVMNRNSTKFGSIMRFEAHLGKWAVKIKKADRDTNR